MPWNLTMTDFQRRQITVNRSNSDCTAKRMSGNCTNHFIRHCVDRTSIRRKTVNSQSFLTLITYPKL